MKVNIECDFIVPDVPDVIKITGNGINKKVPIEELSGEIINKIGDAWKSELLKKYSSIKSRKHGSSCK